MPNRQADAGEVPFACTSHPLGYDFRARFRDCEILKWFAGGTLYLAECDDAQAIIADESALALRLGVAEVPDPISVYLFDTDHARMTYALRRGWWSHRAVRRLEQVGVGADPEPDLAVTR